MKRNVNDFQQRFLSDELKLELELMKKDINIPRFQPFIDKLEVRKKKIHAPQLQPFVERLELKWHISYFSVPNSLVYRIGSDSQKQKHEVWFPAEGEFFLPDAVHELCHGKLAEALGDNFSILRFCKKYDGLEEQKWWQEKATMLFYAFLNLDIWTNDLRHQYWPVLTKEEHQSFCDSVFRLEAMGWWQVLSSMEIILAIAQHMAEKKRHDLEYSDNFSPVLEKLGLETVFLVNKASKFYGSLPRLSFEREKALKMLEESVLEAVRIMRFPISPRLVEEDDRMVWDLGE